MELARRNIPFVKYGGLKFLEAAHVKDTLAILRVLENPFDEVSWFRVLQLPEGMGPATARRLMAELGVRRTAIDQPSPMTHLLDRIVEVPRGAAEGLQSLRSALRGCLDETVLPPAGQLERLRTFLEPVFAHRYDAAGARLADLDQLAQLASAYDARGRFLSELTLDPPSSTGDLAGPPLLDEDYLVLSTIHSAKGLEWDVVHVIHAADGMIPSDMATGDDDEIEEERRLLYVAMTRARDALHISFPMRYYRRPRGLEDPHSYAQLSRFLAHEGVRACFETIAPLADAPRAGDLVVGVDGGRRRRRLPRRTLVGVTGFRRSVGSGDMPPAYRTVLLDLYDTFAWADWHRWQETLAYELGVSSAEIGRAFDVTRPARSVGAYADATADLSAVIREVRLDVAPERIEELRRLERSIIGNGLRLYEDSLPVLRELRSRGVKTALISNCSHDTRPAVDRVGLETEFDAVILSFEVGARKPQPAIYRAALERLDVTAEGAVFVDDQPAYCDGAAALGIDTLLISRDPRGLVDPPRIHERPSHDRGLHGAAVGPT